MGVRFPLELPMGGQYLPRLAARPVSAPIPAIVDGRNCWVWDEYSEVWNGMGAALASMNAGLIIPLSSDALPGGIGTGTVLVWRGDSTWFIGSGSVFRNAAPVATASSALQFILNSVLFVAGLPKPSAPALRLTNESSRKPRGTHSLKLTQVRPETGEESNASEVTNVVFASGQRLLADMTGIATAGDGKRWAIYGSDGGFSQIGPWLFRLEFNSSELGTFTDSDSISRPNSFAFEYYDFETSSLLAPFLFSTPPPGTHLTALGSVMIPLGTFGGSGVSPSLPGKLGWPASFTRFLNPAEPIVRVDGRSGNGWQNVFTPHSVQTILLSGDETGPVFVRGYWPNVGIQNESAACMIESEIYAVSGDGYLVRSNGTEVPDTKFAHAARPDVKNINPATAVVGHYPRDNDTVIFMDGAVAYPFERARETWHTPFDLPGVAQSAATIGGKLYALIGGQLMVFDGGNGSGIVGRVRGAWQAVGNPRHRKAVWGWETVSTAAGMTRLFGNLDASTVLESQTDSGGGHIAQVKTNIKRLKSFALEREMTGGGGQVSQITVDGVVDPSLVDV